MDRQLVVSLYQEYNNVKTVSELMGINYFSVRNILIENKVKILPHPQPKVGVVMLDKQSEQPIKAFLSYKEAAIFLIQNGMSNCGVNGLGSHILDVCKGKRKRRKTVANFKWRTLN